MGAWGRLMTACLCLLPLAGASAAGFDQSSAWFPEVEQLYRTDVHYSREAAARALAWQVQSNAEGQGVAFTVNADDDGLRAVVQKAFDSQRRGDVSNDDTNNEVVVDVAIQGADGATPSLYFHVPAWGSDWFVPYLDKSWVVSPPHPNYVTVRGLAAHDVMGDSDDVMTEAMASVVLPRVQQRLGHRNWGRRAEQIAMRRIRDAMDDFIVVDRFRQTFYTSIGNDDHVALIREAILLDLQEDNVDAVAGPVLRDIRRIKRRSKSVMAISAVVILVTLLVCRLGYMFLNRVTQGYYVWPIRFATATVMLLALGVAATITILNSL